MIMRQMQKKTRKGRRMTLHSVKGSAVVALLAISWSIITLEGDNVVDVESEQSLRLKHFLVIGSNVEFGQQVSICVGGYINTRII